MFLRAMMHKKKIALERREMLKKDKKYIEYRNETNKITQE